MALYGRAVCVKFMTAINVNINHMSLSIKYCRQMLSSIKSQLLLNVIFNTYMGKSCCTSAKGFDICKKFEMIRKNGQTQNGPQGRGKKKQKKQLVVFSTQDQTPPTHPPQGGKNVLYVMKRILYEMGHLTGLKFEPPI